MGTEELALTATAVDNRPLLHILLYKYQQGKTLTDRRTTLWERGTRVQQQSTATVEPAPGPDERHQTSDLRVKPHPTLLPTVHTEMVAIKTRYGFRTKISL